MRFGTKRIVETPCFYGTVAYSKPFGTSVAFGIVIASYPVVSSNMIAYGSFVK